MSAAELWEAYQQAKRDDLLAVVIRQRYEAWFAQCFREGKDPTALDEDSPELDERIAARSIPGIDGHLVWNGPVNDTNQPIVYKRRPGHSTIAVRKYLMRQASREAPPRHRILPVCGEPLCVNIDHLQAESHGWTQHYTDEQMFSRLRGWAKKHGQPPTRAEWAASKARPSARAYISRFGSWALAKRKAGLE